MIDLVYQEQRLAEELFDPQYDVRAGGAAQPGLEGERKWEAPINPAAGGAGVFTAHVRRGAQPWAQRTLNLVRSDVLVRVSMAGEPTDDYVVEAGRHSWGVELIANEHEALLRAASWVLTQCERLDRPYAVLEGETYVNKQFYLTVLVA